MDRKEACAEQLRAGRLVYLKNGRRKFHPALEIVLTLHGIVGDCFFDGNWVSLCEKLAALGDDQPGAAALRQMRDTATRSGVTPAHVLRIESAAHFETAYKNAKHAHHDAALKMVKELHIHFEPELKTARQADAERAPAAGDTEAILAWVLAGWRLPAPGVTEM